MLRKRVYVLLYKIALVFLLGIIGFQNIIVAQPIAQMNDVLDPSSYVDNYTPITKGMKSAFFLSTVYSQTGSFSYPYEEHSTFFLEVLQLPENNGTGQIYEIIQASNQTIIDTRVYSTNWYDIGASMFVYNDWVGWMNYLDAYNSMTTDYKIGYNLSPKTFITSINQEVQFQDENGHDILFENTTTIEYERSTGLATDFAYSERTLDLTNNTLLSDLTLYFVRDDFSRETWVPWNQIDAIEYVSFTTTLTPGDEISLILTDMELPDYQTVVRENFRVGMKYQVKVLSLPSNTGYDDECMVQVTFFDYNGIIIYNRTSYNVLWLIGEFFLFNDWNGWKNYVNSVSTYIENNNLESRYNISFSEDEDTFTFYLEKYYVSVDYKYAYSYEKTSGALIRKVKSVYTGYLDQKQLSLSLTYKSDGLGGQATPNNSSNTSDDSVRDFINSLESNVVGINFLQVSFSFTLLALIPYKKRFLK